MFFMVVLNDFKSLFQYKWFYESMIHRPACSKSVTSYHIPRTEELQGAGTLSSSCSRVSRWNAGIQTRLTVSVFTQMCSGRGCVLLWAGQGLSATHVLWKNCCVLQLLPRRLGGWPETKGISCRNPGASPHLGHKKSPEKKSWCSRWVPSLQGGQQSSLLPSLLLSVPHLGLNKASLQRTDLFLDAGSYRELLFWLFLLHPISIPQTLMLSVDEADQQVNTSNSRHWEL